MKKQFLPLMVMAIGLCGTSMVNAQEVRALLGKAKSETPYLAATSGDALYEMPAVLANIGTHTSETFLYVIILHVTNL